MIRTSGFANAVVGLKKLKPCQFGQAIHYTLVCDAQWEFYGQSGVCLPLPITRQQYQGQQYAFGVFIVLNFVLFLLIGTSQANVWAAIFVLPLNSALNPFLYTLNGLAERWKKEREATRMKKMISKLHSEIPKWMPAAVEELTRICLRSGHEGVGKVP
nr:hypothetical protein BaRGS_028295 [Batillaria attramentaria]